MLTNLLVKGLKFRPKSRVRNLFHPEDPNSTSERGFSVMLDAAKGKKGETISISTYNFKLLLPITKP